jgi:hypothetical protein
MDLTSWLASISWPIVSRVLAALGMGTVTYTGLTTAVNGYFAMAKASLAGLGGTVMQLLAMAGVFDFLSITSGGVISGLTWMVLKKFALQTTGTN